MCGYRNSANSSGNPVFIGKASANSLRVSIRPPSKPVESTKLDEKTKETIYINVRLIALIKILTPLSRCNGKRVTHSFAMKQKTYKV